MPADQISGPFFHCLRIEGLSVLPDKTAVENIFVRTCAYTVTVFLSHRIKTTVKSVIRFFQFFYIDGIGKFFIQCRFQIMTFPRCFQMKISSLSQRMNSAVRSSRTDYGYLLTRHFQKSFFKLPLNGFLRAVLFLPAFIICSVILNNTSVIHISACSFVFVFILLSAFRTVKRRTRPVLKM